jgi:sporulation protein YlmC with PRC-barrel domain
MRNKKTLLLCTLAAFALQTAVAKDQSQSQTSQQTTRDHQSQTWQSSSSAGQSHMTHQSSMAQEKSLRLTKLMDADLKSQDGEDLGDIEDLIIDSQSGKVKFAVVGRGGFLGIGEKHVPVPWKAIQMNSEEEFTVNIDSERLKQAPTLDGNYSNLQDPQFASRVDQFFATGAVGGAEQLEDSEMETDSDYDTSTSGAIHRNTPPAGTSTGTSSSTGSATGAGSTTGSGAGATGSSSGSPGSSSF